MRRELALDRVQRGMHGVLHPRLPLRGAERRSRTRSEHVDLLGTPAMVSAVPERHVHPDQPGMAPREASETLLDEVAPPGLHGGVLGLYLDVHDRGPCNRRTAGAGL